MQNLNGSKAKINSNSNRSNSKLPDTSHYSAIRTFLMASKI